MRNKLRAIAVVSLCMALVGAVLTLLIPTPSNMPSDMNAMSFHSLFFISTVMVITHFGAALLFVLGLRGFSKESKRAYGWLVAGFVTLALGFTQLPLMNLFHLETSAWSRYGLIALPFVASVICIYSGARSFARLFGVKNILTSIPMAICLALAISALSVLLPNAAPNIAMPETTIQVSKFAVMLPAAFNLWAAILAFQARKRAGALYIPATAWLATYLILDSVSSLSGVVVRLFQPGQNIAFDAGYMYVLYAIAGIILLRAGLVFNEISSGQNKILGSEEVTFFGQRKAASTEQGTLPDILIYAAGLASNKEAVDTILDELRIVTATHAANTPFTQGEQQRLAAAYGQLETYLATQEAVRPVSNTDLRASVSAHYAPVLATNSVFAQSIAGTYQTTQNSYHD
jgi:hypothetical protein